MSGLKFKPLKKDVILSVLWIVPIISPHGVLLFKKLTPCVVCRCCRHCVCACKPPCQTNNPQGRVPYFRRDRMQRSSHNNLGSCRRKKRLERAESLVTKGEPILSIIIMNRITKWEMLLLLQSCYLCHFLQIKKEFCDFLCNCWHLILNKQLQPQHLLLFHQLIEIPPTACT